MDAWISTIIALASAAIALATLAYGIVTNRDRFTLSSTERQNILCWYEKTNRLLKLIRIKAGRGEPTNDPGVLAELSALIDLWRFYFPNSDKGDGLGAENSVAFRGHRHFATEYLVLYYDLAGDEKSAQFYNHFNYLQREFTSVVYALLEPEKHMKRMRKNTYIKPQDGVQLAKFLETWPDHYTPLDEVDYS